MPFSVGVRERAPGPAPSACVCTHACTCTGVCLCTCTHTSRRGPGEGGQSVSPSACISGGVEASTVTQEADRVAVGPLSPVFPPCRELCVTEGHREG